MPAFVDHMKLQHSRLQHIASKAFEEPELALKHLDDAFAFASMAWENRKKFTKLSEEEVAVLPVWFAAWKLLDDAKYLVPDSTGKGTEREIIETAEEATKGFEIEIEAAIRAATYAAHTTYGGKDDDSLISLEIARLITLDEINRVMKDILYLNTDSSVLSPLVEILVALETKINRILSA